MGRNWTRRSIEELIDDYLKKRGSGGVVMNSGIPALEHCPGLFSNIYTRPSSSDCLARFVELFMVMNQYNPEWGIGGQQVFNPNYSSNNLWRIVAMGKFSNMQANSIVDLLSLVGFWWQGTINSHEISDWSMPYVYYYKDGSSPLYLFKDTSRGYSDQFSVILRLNHNTIGALAKIVSSGSQSVADIWSSQAFADITNTPKDGIFFFSDRKTNDILGFVNHLYNNSITTVQEIDIGA